jgi:hypothetical protein
MVPIPRAAGGADLVWWYLWVVRHSGKVILGAAVVLGAVACVFLVVVVVGQGVVRASLWAGVLAALAGVVAAVAAIWPLARSGAPRLWLRLSFAADRLSAL